METRTLSEDVLFNGKRSIILIKTCVVKIKVTKKKLWRESQEFFGLTSWLGSSHGEIQNDHGNHPTPQNNKRIVRRSTKSVQNEILLLSNFRLQNLSNLDAAIQIFLYLHKPNSTIFHSYVTFRLTLNKCLHLNTMIFAYRVFSRLHLITNLWDLRVIFNLSYTLLGSVY